MERCIWASRVVLNVPLRIKIVGFDAGPFVDHQTVQVAGSKQSRGRSSRVLNVGISRVSYVYMHPLNVHISPQ